MPNVTVYLSDDLLAVMKLLDLAPSGLLQDAIRREAMLDEKRRLMDEYLAELREEVGPPTADDIAWVEQVLAPLHARQQAS